MSQALPHTLSRTTTFTLGTSPPMQLPTTQAFPLMQSPNLTRTMSAQPLLNANNVTKVLLAQSTCLHKPPAQTWPQRTRSSWRTTTSHQEVTGMRPFMLSITHYIHSTINYGIMFTSAEQSPLHSCMLFPASLDTEAYTDASPPSNNQNHRLTTYSDACWGSQLGNAVREGIQLPLFKFRSMSGAIVMQSGGPLVWKAERQERTSLSSCKTKIRATNMGARLTVNTRNMISSLSNLGYPIDNTALPTPLHNNNDACVKWCHNMTTKGNRHIKNHENSTHEWVADGTIIVTHVSSKCNISDIFTKEMRDGANFRWLRNSFMCQASDYLKGRHHLVLAFNIDPSSKPAMPSPALAQSTQIVPPTRPGIMDVLLSYPCLRTSSTLSCISTAGHHILSRLTPPSYLQTLMSNPMGSVLT
jgi:hypothetical protein